MTDVLNIHSCELCSMPHQWKQTSTTISLESCWLTTLITQIVKVSTHNSIVKTLTVFSAHHTATDCVPVSTVLTQLRQAFHTGNARSPATTELPSPFWLAFMYTTLCPLQQNMLLHTIITRSFITATINIQNLFAICDAMSWSCLHCSSDEAPKLAYGHKQLTPPLLPSTPPHQWQFSTSALIFLVPTRFCSSTWSERRYLQISDTDTKFELFTSLNSNIKAQNGSQGTDHNQVRPPVH